MANKNILLISSGQPALNPRLMKEADALYKAGYSVTVMYQYWNSWGTEMDKSLLLEKPWTAVRIGGSPSEKKRIYWFTRIVNRIARNLLRITLGFGIAEVAAARSAWLLKRSARKYKADLYIAHNLAALPAAVKAAKTNNAMCGFDAEDFHRFEVSDNPRNIAVRLAKYLEDAYFPEIDYLTAASPMISAKYKGLYPVINPVTILNVFPRVITVNTQQNAATDPLNLFWFSQTIGNDRGIEEIISAVALCKQNVFNIHLLGSHDGDTIAYFTSYAESKGMITSNLIFHHPVPPGKLLELASKFDIGLAAETGIPENRDICLTNKLFTYIQAGLAVLASDTRAHTDFIKQYTEIGILYKRNNSQSLAEALTFYSANKSVLQKVKDDNFRLGQDTMNWDQEKKIFLNLVSKTLST